MIREKYEKPIMEVVDLKDDVILTSGATYGCSGDCPSHGIGQYCGNDCPSYHPWDCHTYNYVNGKWCPF